MRDMTIQSIHCQLYIKRDEESNLRERGFVSRGASIIISASVYHAPFPISVTGFPVWLSMTLCAVVGTVYTCIVSCVHFDGLVGYCKKDVTPVR